MQKWEYRVIIVKSKNRFAIEDQLLSLGEEGWELVAVAPSSEFASDRHILYVKRPIE